MSPVAAPVPAPETALTFFLAAVAVQRAVELSISARHTRTLVAYGAREFGRGHFPLLVAIHLLFPAALAYEVLALGARPARIWPLWLVVWLVAQLLRIWAI